MATLQNNGAQALLHAFSAYSTSADVVALNCARFDVLPYSLSTQGLPTLQVHPDAWPQDVEEQARGFRIVVDGGPARGGDLSLVCLESGEILLADCANTDSFCDAHTGKTLVGKVDLLGVVVEKHSIYIDAAELRRRSAAA